EERSGAPRPCREADERREGMTEIERPRIEKRMVELRAEIERHRRLYYDENRPEITDGEYDRLEAELARLEEEHPELASTESPTRRVGERPIGAFRTTPHAAPMLSHDNSYSRDEVLEFDAPL